MSFKSLSKGKSKRAQKKGQKKNHFVEADKMVFETLKSEISRFLNTI